MNSSQQARNLAMTQVARGAGLAWLRAAGAAVRVVARRQASLTTDDVWRELTAQGWKRPTDPRAMGPVMKEAMQDGYINRTDMTQQTTRKAAHARPLRIWESLLYARRTS